MRYLLKLLLHTILTLIIIAMFLLCFLLTPYGFRFSVYVAEKILPGQLHYQELSGLITGPISVLQLDYTNKGKHLHINRLNLDWSPLALIHNRLEITHFTAHGITLITPKKAEQHISTAKESPQEQIHDFLQNIKPYQPKPFKLPMSIKIDHAYLTDIKLGHTEKDITTDIKYITINGHIYPNNINIKLQTEVIKPQDITATLTANGSLNQYVIHAELQNKLFELTAHGEGNQDGAVITIPESKLLKGTIKGVVKVNWYPQINWDIALNVDHLRLRKLVKSLPKKVSLNLNTQGKIIKSNPIFDFVLKAQADKSTIDLEAHHHKQWHIKWNIKAPDLSDIDTAATGSLTMNGELRGDSLLLPQTTGLLLASKLHYSHIDIGNLKAQWNIFFDAKTLSKMDLLINKIDFNEHKINIIHFNASGHLLKHDMTASLDIGKHSMQMTTKAHYQGNTWVGAITQFVSEHNAFGNWKLRHIAKFEISPLKSFLQPLCLDANTGAFLCMQGHWEKNKPWNFTVESKRFSFVSLEKHAMINTKFTSLISMNAQASGVGSNVDHANAKINIQPGMMTYLLDNKVINTTIRPSTLSLLINKKVGLESSANINLAIRDSFNLHMNIPDFNDHSIPFKDKQLRSNIDFLLHDFRFVTLIENVLRISLGKLSGHFTYNGTVGNAKLEGNAHLQIPHFEYTLAMVHAHNIDAHIKADGKKITYNLVGYTFNKAPVYLKGETDLTTPYAVTKFVVTTKNGEVIKTPQMSVYADATLKFLLTHTDLNIDGDIHIPKANISPVDFTSTLAMPKANVVYIGLPKKDEPKESHKTILNLKIKLGDDVRFAAFGARAKLAGGLVMKMSPKQTMIANGQINITEGTFQAYGQYLVINKGSSVSFIESPITNPFIDARAFKYVNTTTEGVGTQLAENNLVVGVHIHGTIRALKFTLYSQPPGLSQADILSYLVLGYASGNTNAASLSVLLDAANAMIDSGGGLDEPVGLTDRIKQGLGIKELGVRNETVVDAIGNPIEDQSSFVVGDQLTKNIYVRYSRGMVVPDNIFTIEYRFNKHWLLQTQTGSGGNVGTGADILYQIETN
jgi:translocation and assembly module TamB